MIILQKYWPTVTQGRRYICFLQKGFDRLRRSVFSLKALPSYLTCTSKRIFSGFHSKLSRCNGNNATRPCNNLLLASEYTLFGFHCMWFKNKQLLFMTLHLPVGKT